MKRTSVADWQSCPSQAFLVPGNPRACLPIFTGLQESILTIALALENIGEKIKIADVEERKYKNSEGDESKEIFCITAVNK